MPWAVRITKRALDLFVSTFVLTCFSWALILIAFIIRLDSPGPALYKQQRVKRVKKHPNGFLEVETFNILKFRTMVQDAEKLSGAVNASENDARITQVGKFLRSTRVDEIPNLINVLVGDMSIVGPRADRREIFEQVEKMFPTIWERSQFVKPGITGSAQLNLRSNGTPSERSQKLLTVTSPSDIDQPVDSFRYKLYYDFAYIMKLTNFWTFLKTDLSIMIQTPYVMFIRRNTI